MMPRDVEFHPRAIEEARAARRWYATRSDAAADRFLIELDRAMRRVATVPETGAPSFHGTRLHRIRRFPYLVVFREAGLVLCQSKILG